MKKLMIILFAIILMVGCAESERVTKNTLKTAASSQEAVSESQQIAVMPSSGKTNASKNVIPPDIYQSPIGVKTIIENSGDFGTEVFINADEGWKKYYLKSEDKIVLSKTTDGGKNWSEIANSDNAAEPLGMGLGGVSFVYQSGLTFLNNKVGWITINTPQAGYIGLYKTLDGGITWNLQSLNIPNESREYSFGTMPPVFFSQKDGLLIISQYEDNHAGQLVFVTHDGGNTWTATIEDTYYTNLKWNLRKTLDRVDKSILEVTYKNDIWQSAYRLDWVKSDSDITANDDVLRSYLLSANKLTVSKELVKTFFEYNNEHKYELRLLPSFKDGESPDWDDLTHFVFAMADRGINSQNELFVSAENFDETVKKYFKDIIYTPRDSLYINYTGTGYTPTGWDDDGGVYYCLKSITKDDDTYVATFDGIKLSESDYSADYDHASPNMKVIMKEANRKTAPYDVEVYIHKLFTFAGYERLEINENVTVKFKLSDNPDTLFTYLAADRKYY